MILDYFIAAGCFFMLGAATLSLVCLGGWCITSLVSLFRT